MATATLTVGAERAFNFGSNMLLQSILKAEEKDSDANRTISEVVASRGYVCEEHRIETTDGYILTAHRIVNPEVPKEKRRPILVQHGFTSNSIHWLIASPDGHIDGDVDAELAKLEDSLEEKTTSNLGFALAKNGFDVWLGNFRGNRYALEHKTLDPKDTEFWDFSLDEFIDYDLPSTIDYILAETGQGKRFRLIPSLEHESNSDPCLVIV